jgi:hypothetical protein
MNFIVVELCDNDFGWKIQEALLELVDKSPDLNFCPEIAKRYIIEYILCDYRKDMILNERHYSDNQFEKRISELKDYLSKIRVTFRDKLPTYTPEENSEVINHDGGSAYYDVNLKKAFSL